MTRAEVADVTVEGGNEGVQLNTLSIYSSIRCRRPILIWEECVEICSSRFPPGNTYIYNNTYISNHLQGKTAEKRLEFHIVLVTLNHGQVQNRGRI